MNSKNKPERGTKPHFLSNKISHSPATIPIMNYWNILKINHR